MIVTKILFRARTLSILGIFLAVSICTLSLDGNKLLVLPPYRQFGIVSKGVAINKKFLLMNLSNSKITVVPVGSCGCYTEKSRLTMMPWSKCWISVTLHIGNQNKGFNEGNVAFLCRSTGGDAQVYETNALLQYFVR